MSWSACDQTYEIRLWYLQISAVLIVTASKCRTLFLDRMKRLTLSIDTVLI